MTDNKQTETREQRLSFLMIRKRLISFPEERENEEFNAAMATDADIGLSEIVKDQEELMEALNKIELATRANHRAMIQRTQEIARLEERNRALKNEARKRKLAVRVLEILQRTPETGLSDLAGVLNATESEVQQAAYMLENEGKLRQRICRRLYDILVPVYDEKQEPPIEDEDLERTGPNEDEEGDHHGYH